MAAWVDYLLAAYPATKATSGTVVVLERQFAGVDEREMLRVAEEAVRRYRFMPSVNELRAVRAKLAESEEEQEAAGWAKLTRMEKLRREIDSWRECPGGCGERVPPGVTLCPFCADLCEMIAMAGAEVVA